MKENYILMFGKDILRELHVDQKHVRLFCEQQVKGKFLHLRQAYLEIGHDQKRLRILLNHFLHDMIPIFRNLIRLKGQMPPLDKKAVLREMTQLYGFYSDHLIRGYEWTLGEKKLSAAETLSLMETYLRQMSQLAQDIDRL